MRSPSDDTTTASTTPGIFSVNDATNQLKLTASVLSAFVLIVLLPTLAFAQRVGSPVPFTIGVTETFHSKALGEDRILHIHLPPGYPADTVAAYAVIYLPQAGSVSNPTKWRPVRTAATAVEPTPMKGSSTRSRDLLLFFTARSTNSTGFIVGCRSFFCGFLMFQTSPWSRSPHQWRLSPSGQP